MPMKKFNITLIIILLIFSAILSVFIINRKNFNLLDDAEVQLDIINHLNSTNANIKIKYINIEKTESIADKLVILYSVDNSAVRNKTCGFATYQRMKNGKLKRMTNILTANSFGIELINSSDNSNSYLVTYGMNSNSKTQIYKHISGDKEEIIEFSGDYFLVTFSGNVENKFIPIDTIKKINDK